MEEIQAFSFSLLDDMANEELYSAVVDGIRENTIPDRISCCPSGDGSWYEKRHVIPRPWSISISTRIETATHFLNRAVA
jgi:hypothetical protein